MLAIVDDDDSGLCWTPLLVPCCWEERVGGEEICEEAWRTDGSRHFVELGLFAGSPGLASVVV